MTNDFASLFRPLGLAARLAFAGVAISIATAAVGADWTVPLAGNAYRAPVDRGGRLFSPDGALRVSDGDATDSVYFHVDRPGVISLALRARAVDGDAAIEARVGDHRLTTSVRGAEENAYPLGEVSVAAAGYVRVDLQASGGKAEVSQLVVQSDVDGMTLDYVKNNEGDMYYWGRRGPSVHLQYETPAKIDLTYAYSELTVPEGQDALGAYYMANGFGEGYFGIQVNSPGERRVLFSVWSPFRTDNPKEIPEDQRVATLAKGEGVTAKDFGNEGSGGQSYLVYPWTAGTTYRFLTEVKPDGEGNTIYTSWFGDKAKGTWRLIASFRRPKTDRHLTGFHSFLENFIPDFGALPRTANYGNQWVCDVDGNWHEIPRARLTGDNTARGGHRLDYACGAVGKHFFMKHCGFFSPRVALDQTFQREPDAGSRPAIEFDRLPRG
ncbi:hypothetical protein EC9_26150 [Rosistilla ulvae]|uniref:DUF5077 domain-containing protein n=1 Tax=Rosistilla ulvae TaxID=1930277 RepID=A0A517M0L7_9BACT|nr:DUF3472 domain-containing protein [Rosistilla ulvae]QDS88425.1 hypothetical protein EC9_26150 [Rosistilla ulvae]